MAELLSSASCWTAASLPKMSSILSAPNSSNSPLLEVNLPSLSKSRSVSLGVAPLPMMGGGPRTYPGGVTKWQWKRMQQKKEKQILKARLLRERQIYEARRRAELMAATPELEMPWQKMSRVRPPSYVAPDEHLKKLAGRFQKDGAEDLWTEKDGPETFERGDGQSLTTFGHSNASRSTMVHEEMDRLAISDENDGKSFLDAISGRATGRKLHTASSPNLQSHSQTRGAGFQYDFASKSEGFSPRKIQSQGLPKRDAVYRRAPDTTEDHFRSRSSVSGNSSRRNVESIRPTRGLNKDGKVNNWPDTGESFLRKFHGDSPKSRTEQARLSRKHSMHRQTPN